MNSLLYWFAKRLKGVCFCILISALFGLNFILNRFELSSWDMFWSFAFVAIVYLAGEADGILYEMGKSKQGKWYD